MSIKKLYVYLLSLTLIFSATIVIPGPIVKADTQFAIYVDPLNGQDTNDGLSTASAFQTIEHARDVVRTMNSNMTNDIHVYLKGGTYTLTSTLSFTEEDSGTNGFNIIYSAYNGEKPIISGGKQITGWTLYDASKNIYSAYAGGDIETRQLFVNGSRATRAKSTGAPSPLTFVKASGYSATGNVLANSTIPMHNWGNKSDIEFVYKNEWTAPRIGVSTISNNGTTTTFTMKQPGWKFVTNKGGTSVGGTHNTNGLPWYIENAYELLDAEGEWYLDRSTDYFYYKPRAEENISTASIVVPTLEELVRIEGSDLDHKASNIQFNGVTFSYATYLRVNGDGGLPDAQNNVLRDYVKDENGNDVARESIVNAAVNLKYATSIKFERDIFEHLGGSGLNMYAGSQDNLVVGSVFTDISGNGIQVGDYTGLYTAGTENYAQSTDTRAILRNNDVNNSYFNKIGLEYFASTAIAASLPQDMDITHNEISNVPYSGIHVGWGWTLFPTTVHQRTNIQYNYVHDYMAVLRDGGGIYTLGATGGSDTNKSYISNNYIQNQLNPFGALYPDEASSWYEITDNVVNNASRYLHIWINTIHDINVNNTYTTTSNSVNSGIRTTVSNTTVVTNGNWPANALNIMNQAGLESAYQDIKSLSITPPDPVPPMVTDPTYELFQDFNNEITGSAPANWTVPAVGTGTTQIVEVPSAADKSVKMSRSTSGQGGAGSRTFSPITAGSFEIKAMASQTNAYAYIAFLGDGAKTFAAVTFKNNGKIAYMKSDANWYDIVSYTANTWYTIKIVFNTITDKYDLYINGNKVLSQAPSQSASGTGNITVLSNGIYSGNAGTIYIDDLHVKSEPQLLSDQDIISLDKQSLRVGYADGDFAASVTQNVYLSTAGVNGTTVTWSSNNPAIIAADGTVTRPAWNAADTTVTLTATIAKGAAVDTKSFTLRVLKLRDSINPDTVADLNGIVGTGGWYISDATVSLSASDDLSGVSSTAYSLDGSGFTVYTSPITLSDGIHELKFRSADNAGNVETVHTVNVSIDKTAPVDAVLSADITAPTNKDVNVTISYPDDATVKEYKVGENGEWTAYGAPVVVSENCKVYARGTDAAGNVSKETNFTVSNIDHIAPIDATLAVDTTAPTNQGVSVMISYPSDATVKEYKVGDNGAWKAYTEPVVVSDNDTVYARGTDAVGNVSNVTSITVSNIFKIAPTTTATLSPTAPNGKNSWYTTDVTVSLSVSASVYGGSVATEYQVNDGEWIVYTGSIPAFGDGTYKFGYRSKDQAGNVELTKTIEFKVDKTAPALSIQLDKTSIWPANHTMVTINATLNSSDVTSDVESVVLTSITSNQPDSGQGDIQANFGTAATSFSLRAEKSRIYTITYTATDKAGNKTVTSVTVTVPHDQSGEN
ncbi:OmpL47-type beta-barrel domain-containing protein [Paenibacillus montanisoli]|uniref:OmpL47-type beta-barrel domain-containing protein n=1 Tax=Paenibacillus montanisoli TaxID=2081970 RepID=UPI001F0B9531|nr:immunoglobulin-like domain-containing protein [Paenibacillus montanisoli]